MVFRSLFIVLHVLWCVREGGAVLGGGVLWPVGSNVAQDHHDRTVRVHPFRHTKVVDAVVGDDVCQVVLWSERTLSIRHSISDRRSRCPRLLYNAVSAPITDVLWVKKDSQTLQSLYLNNDPHMLLNPFYPIFCFINDLNLILSLKTKHYFHTVLGFSYQGKYLKLRPHVFNSIKKRWSVPEPMQ